MGWRGTMRSIAAAARAAERESQRRHKQEQKEQMIANAADAVDDWENYIKELISIHTNTREPIDWLSIANRTPPNQPLARSVHQDSAESELRKFKPSLFHIFRGGSEKLRQKLEQEVEKAAIEDEEQYRKDLAEHADIIAEWEEDTSLAKCLLKGDITAIKKVLEETKALSGTALVGSSIEFSINDNFLHARPQVHGDEVIPRFRRKQLASGRLSETKMPVGQFNELYQDYVASAALKTAGDLFQILPLEEIYVTCMANMLNPQTGHKELTPILSVQFVRSTFFGLNLAGIDPSDAIRNFRHTMRFAKTKGFSPTEPLAPIAT